MRVFRNSGLILAVGGVTLAAAAQSVVQPQASAFPTKTGADVPAATFKSYTRMVTFELVAKDSKGKHITGLKPEDFQLLEQTPDEGKQLREQTIAEFREVHVKGFGASAASPAASGPGVYSNTLKIATDPAPATILLVDGINTPLKFQMQVHTQMLKMLRQLPPNVPVAVFLLGDRLTLLQGYTTDPQLLQTALGAAHSTAGKGLADINPLDDPYAAGNSMGGFDYLNDPGLAQMTAAARAFDQRVYANQMTSRVNRTAEALISLSRNVAGYPGRKNLLWMSTAFPFNVNVFSVGESASQAVYSDVVNKVNRALSQAGVAVYPIDVGGVQTISAFEAGSRPPDVSAAAVERNVEQIESQYLVMQSLAENTGGKVCTGTNELADCVRNAMEDSSDFYEISYYPNSPNWNGEYRRIILKSREREAHLAYRNWYAARGEENPDPRAQSSEMRADCDDFLNATALPFTVRNVASDMPDQLRFLFQIDPSAVAFSATGDGGRSAKLAIAVCTLNQKRWPVDIMMYPVNLNLTEQQYNQMIAAREVRQLIFVPGKKPAAVRLMVKDLTTGNLGSILIKTDRISTARK